MVRRVAECMLDDHDAAEIMADRVFLGHADAAMQLHPVLRYETRGLTDPGLDDRNVARALRFVWLIERHRRQHRQAAPLFERDKHFGGTVLQRLVAADRLAELLAGLQ